MAELEIEFKNMLTQKEYDNIYEYYDLDKEYTINNYNYYYDDRKENLKNNNSALRIRHANNKLEITLKIKGSKANIEINEAWNNKDVFKTLNVSDLPKSIKEKLLAFNVDKNLILIQEIKTVRKEKILAKGLLVLDKTYFLKDIIDYELEFEVAEYQKGKIDFEKILEKFSIPHKKAEPKIARAIKYANFDI